MSVLKMSEEIASAKRARVYCSFAGGGLTKSPVRPGLSHSGGGIIFGAQFISGNEPGVSLRSTPG